MDVGTLVTSVTYGIQVDKVHNHSIKLGAYISINNSFVLNFVQKLKKQSCKL